MSQPPLLTPEEVADLLRICPAEVNGVLEDDRLVGIPIAGHWRVRTENAIDFLREGLRRENVRAVEKALNDPARWAKVLREFPDLMTSIEQEEYSPNSPGAFLKDALKYDEAAAEDTHKRWEQLFYTMEAAYRISTSLVQPGIPIR